jgi:hypothetical protein
MTEAIWNESKMHKENPQGFFEKIAYILKILFKTEKVKRKRNQDELIVKQEFFLPRAISYLLYHIKPQQKLKIGPIFYAPTNFSSDSATLFIKNNLTILYPIKLRGIGGSGMINFFLEEEGEVKQIDKLVINIDSFESNFIRKNIIMKNVGNLPYRINNITLENSGCEGFGIKINNCNGMTLKPEDSEIITISIEPDYNFYYIEKDIILESQYSQIRLHVSINISNEILSQNNRLFSLDNIRNCGIIALVIVIFIQGVICYILSFDYFGEKVGDNIGQLEFINAKDVINKNSRLKFENLFVKSFRKSNQGHDDFINKQIDKPGFDIDLRDDKRKHKNVSPIKKEEIVDEVKNVEPKEEQKAKVVTKVKQVKKEPKVKTTSAIKKPIGVPLKPNEKREEDKKPIEPLIQVNKNENHKVEPNENHHLNPHGDNNMYWDYNNYYQRNIYYNKQQQYNQQYPPQRQNNFYNYNNQQLQQQQIQPQPQSQPQPQQQPYNNIRNNAQPNIPVNNIQYKPTETKPNKKIENEKDTKPEVTSTASDLKDQFMSFVPDIFNKKVNESENKYEKKEESKELIDNFKNFDFTNIFTRNDDQDIPEEDDNKIEEEVTSIHYQSEKEKILIEDSGTEERREEIKFNFNSIFGDTGGMKLITPVDDYTDYEEPKDNLDGNKPYFDKALFFSFDASFNKPQGGGMFTNSGSSLFSANPFAATSNKKLLSELIDDDKPEVDEGRDKLDDVVENEDDEEDDPLWCDEEIDTKNDGYFDQAGTYKLKQMDFNFDYDFNKK